MKQSIPAALCAASICLLLPYFAAVKTGAKPQKPEKSAETIVSVTQKQDIAASFDEETELTVLDNGQAISMNMHEYLVGVLLGEMPLSFHEQALRAQAVACRTYALRKLSSKKHAPAAVCTDSACCQSWVSPKEYADEQGSSLLQKAEAAVSDTDGEVLTYNGALIDATFFSCSGGTTEAAVAVWGSDIAYLQSTQSPGEENASHYEDTVTFDLETFCGTLKQADAAVDFSGSCGTWLQETTYTQGGSVNTMELGGRVFTGVQLRRLFHLYSTDFELTIADDAVFTTHGYGHRVGMSQYGANAMAEQGSGYAQILAWYYRGTEQKKLLRLESEQLIFSP